MNFYHKANKPEVMCYTCYEILSLDDSQRLAQYIHVNIENIWNFHAVTIGIRISFKLPSVEIHLYVNNQYTLTPL